MPDNRIADLLEEWQSLKNAETLAKEDRLAVEDKVLDLLAKPETFKGTVKLGDFSVTYGESVKVDTAELQAIFERGGVSREEIDGVIRWKAELNSAAWKAANPHTRLALSGAIETKPSKPSFSRK